MSETETEINPLRVHMVRKAIAEHPDEPITIEALAKHLPPDFELGDDDLASFKQQTDALFEIAPVKMGSKLLDPEAAARLAAEAEAPEVAAPLPPDPEAVEAAVKRRIKADQDLANRRVELLAAQSAERDARAALAAAVTQFQVGFPKMTPEQLRREHVREQAEIRAAIKDGRLQPRKNPGHGKSRVDQMAYYGRGGPAANGNYRRGAFPSQSYGTTNTDPRRGAVGKPPGA